MDKTEQKIWLRALTLGKHPHGIVQIGKYCELNFITNAPKRVSELENKYEGEPLPICKKEKKHPRIIELIGYKTK
jgi:hypothetical protein